MLQGKNIVRLLNSILNRFSNNLNFQFQINKSVSRLNIEWFFRLIEPLDFGFELMRIGPENDGGYVVPNDLEGIGECISPRVGNSIDFEQSLFETFGIRSHLADPTTETKIYFPDGISFTPIGIGASKEFTSITNMQSGKKELHQVVSLEEFTIKNIKDNNSDLILQMDIENSEYIALLSSSSEFLEKFRIMIIEFHSIPDIFSEKYFNEIIAPLFKKLNRIFYVAHIHANNVSKPKKIFNYSIPHAIEITFHNRKRVTGKSFVKNPEIYSIYDRPSDPSKDEIYLDKLLFSKFEK